MDIIREKILKNWMAFLKESTRAREKLVQDFDKAVARLDNTVAAQRQATVLLLKKALSLKEGDEIRLFSDGRYEIVENSGGLKMENTEKQKETVTLNGREISKEELEKQKEAAAAQQGAKLEEVSKGNYRMKLQG